MKKKIFYNILILSLTIVVGCGDNKENYQEYSIKQIQWEGILSNKDTVCSIAIVFEYENSGYYIIDNESFGFSYYRDNRAVQISGYNGDLLNGEWHINKLTQNNFILKLQPLIEGKSSTLTLKKIN